MFTSFRFFSPLFSTALLFLSVPRSYAADQSEPERPPNIVWINAEDMSPHLGCYGHPDARTPRIDELAKQSILYRNAFATAPICSPSRSCLATGIYATSLGTQHLRCEVEIPSEVVPLATRLQQVGYFCTNTGKSDYNFPPDGIWDAWTNAPGPWRGREEGQPFFSFITVGETHEGGINIEDRYQRATADLPPEYFHDPDSVQVPPFYPDTTEMRRIVAGMHDLASVFDQKVGNLVDQLKADGEWENTILFVFSDHGNGLPRYKRWLTDSGLRVPLIVHVPQRYAHLAPTGAGEATDRLVSFVDFPATAVRLAGLPVESPMQGIPFLGRGDLPERQFVYGARDRADDMFDMARSVFDGRFLYVRHFMPHLPYLQNSVIFDDRKSSIRELRRLRQADTENEVVSRLWQAPKASEELYDLQSDPYELHNLADDPDLADKKEALAKQLRTWMLEHRDSGLLTEIDYQIGSRAAGITPYELMQDSRRIGLDVVLDSAWDVADPSVPATKILERLSDSEQAVRYWAAVALRSRELVADERLETALAAALHSPSPSVQIAVADLAMRSFPQGSNLSDAAASRLAANLLDQRPWVSLKAAATLRALGRRSESLVPEMKTTVQRNLSGPSSPRLYKDFNYASFTGWALERALAECGEGDWVEALKAKSSRK